MKILLTIGFTILSFQILYGQIGRISLSNKTFLTQSEYSVLYDSIQKKRSEVLTGDIYNYLSELYF